MGFLVEDGGCPSGGPAFPAVATDRVAATISGTTITAEFTVTSQDDGSTSTFVFTGEPIDS